MITLKDVKMWAVEKKRKYSYGHIVMNRRDYWVTTLCGTWSPSYDKITEHREFDRVCPKCAGNMEKAVIAEREGMMKYMGSKNRIAKHILPIILKDRKPNQLYIEPFCGGCNTIDKVDGRRLATDVNEYLISMYIALQNGWTPPKTLTENEYAHIKNNKGDYPPELVSFVGFACSYAGKWFGGYCRGKASDGRPRDYIDEAYRNMMKQKPALDRICFSAGFYEDFDFPEESIIYCDPPYENTTKYKSPFNHSAFWQWCREMTCNENQVFVSEYNAPDDFECIWSKEIVSSLTKNTGSKKGIEKLFVYDKEK